MSNSKNSLKQSGFSLIELMIVLVILALIISIAIPSYTDYVTRTKRGDGMGALLGAAEAMERYKANNNFSFVGACIDNCGGGETKVFNDVVPVDGSGDPYYNIVLTNVTATTFTLQANPTGGHASNDGFLRLTQSGAKRWRDVDGNVSTCWPTSGKDC